VCHKDLDAVAYVRFASVYREFKDVNTFFDELRKAMNLDERFEPIVLFTCGRPLSFNSNSR